ncbi:UNKNOWN [Stylonychia lemnae]|uniref:Uncharacterized protein n=1 Tax=Stylonychia lemnae TaxID=5949 RepID=A0A078ADB6_STYLE|nr:UNKNOWN [Stylonychia lemnae]|eukprot:CDW79836.1 UNKNOWN [Stylonychia lemnae]
MIYAGGGNFEKTMEKRQGSNIRPIISIMSMGNMATASSICANGEIFNKTVSLEFKCETGIIYGLKDQKIGLEGEDISLSCVNTDFMIVDQDCSYYSFNTTIQKRIDKWFIDQCNGKQSSYEQSFYGKIVDKSNIGIMLVLFDIVVLILYLISLGFLKNFQKIDALEINGDVMKCSDFSILIRNLPTNPNVIEYKAWLWEWIEKKLAEHDDQDQNNKSYIPKIVEIYFGYTDYSDFGDLKEIRSLEKAMIEQRKKLKFDKSGQVENYRALQKIVGALKGKIEEYEKNSKKREKKLIPKFAYVILLHENDKKRLLNLYDIGWKRKMLLKYKQRDKYNSLCFDNGQFPDLVQAPQPSLVMWSNLKFDNIDIFKRSLQINIVTFLLMLVSFFLVIYGKYQDKIIKKIYGGDQCKLDDEITQQMAEADFKQPREGRHGLMHCFCLNRYTSLGQEVVSIKFDDSLYYCSDWFDIYTAKNGYVYYAGFAISFVNILIKFVIGKISFYQRMHTLNEILENTTLKMFLFQVVNTGVILMLVNWNLKDELGLPDNFPVLTGDYTDFTVNWYQKIGVQLFVYFGLKYFATFWDRKFRPCNKRRTRQYIQEDYQSQYLGPPFGFEKRYSSMMAVIFITFIFSAVLRVHQKPVMTDGDLANKLRVVLSFAAVWHLGIAFLMMSSESIFPLVSLFNDNQYQKKQNEMEAKFSLPSFLAFIDEKRLNHDHSFLTFIAFFISLIFSLFYDTLVKLLIKLWNKIKNMIGCKQKASKMQQFDDILSIQEIKTQQYDFYEAIGIQGIISEKKRSQQSLEEIEKFMKDNEVSHKLRKLHHRFIIKIDTLDKLLTKKQQDAQSLLKRVFLQGLMNKKREKEGLKRVDDPELAFKDVSFPCKVQGLLTYDIKENDFYKDVYATAERLDQIKKEIQILDADNIDVNSIAEIRNLINS